MIETEEIIDTVTSYANGFERVLTESGMTSEALDELLLAHNVEQCPCCDWYTDSHLLLNEDGEIDDHCDNCREK